VPPSARRLVTHHVMCVDMRRAARQEEGRGNQGLFSSRSPTGSSHCHTPVLEYGTIEMNDESGHLCLPPLGWVPAGHEVHGLLLEQGQADGRPRHVVDTRYLTCSDCSLAWPVPCMHRSPLWCSRSHSHCRFLPVTEANAWKNPEKG
jgi:hypothetical protein